MNYQMQEWLAWRAMCVQLSNRGIDPNANENDLLIRAIRHYAATYHQLYPEGELHSQAEPDARLVEPLIQALR